MFVDKNRIEFGLLCAPLPLRDRSRRKLVGLLRPHDCTVSCLPRFDVAFTMSIRPDLVHVAVVDFNDKRIHELSGGLEEVLQEVSCQRISRGPFSFDKVQI